MELRVGRATEIPLSNTADGKPTKPGVGRQQKNQSKIGYVGCHRGDTDDPYIRKPDFGLYVPWLSAEALIFFGAIFRHKNLS